MIKAAIKNGHDGCKHIFPVSICYESSIRHSRTSKTKTVITMIIGPIMIAARVCQSISYLQNEHLLPRDID